MLSTANRKDAEGEWNKGFLRAVQRGLVAMEAGPRELQIDLDSARALRRYGLQFAILRRAGLATSWREKITPSRKRGHVHVTITLPKPRPLLERIALQAILGSDLTREMFNWCRAENGWKYPVVFFEPERKGTKPCRPKRDR